MKIRETKPLNYNTIKFLIEFFHEFTLFEEENRMTAYNLAVTMGPNIMRRVKEKDGDFINHGAMYEALITIMTSYEELFEGLIDEEAKKEIVSKSSR